MKRKLVTVMLCTMIAVAGCGNGGSNSTEPATTAGESQSTDGGQSEEPDSGADEGEHLGDTSEPQDAGSDTAKDDAGDSAQSSGTYANKLFGITLPDDVADLAEVEVSDDRIDVYHKESKDAGFGGLICSVWAVAVPKEYAGGPYEKIGELSNENAEIYDVVRGYATEIQWDYNLEDMPETFKKLDEAADSIIASTTGVEGYNFIAGAGTKGEDLYNSVLAKYVSAVNDKWDPDKLEEEGMSPEFNTVIAVDGGLDSIGYAYLDVNVDGIEELMIAPMIEGVDEGMVYDIYTMVNHEPKLVVSGTARNKYYVNDNFVYNVWSGGAAMSGFDMYALMSNDTEMVYQVGYKYDGYENEKEPWFRSYDGNEYESISEEDYNSGVDNFYNEFTKLDFKKLSECTDAIGLSDYDSSKKSDSSLPAYEYPGPELFFTVLYDYMISEFGQNYEKADVCIPCPYIIKMDENDKNDIKVWGDFWINNYKLDGDTLECVSGGSYPGCIHVKSTDAGYEVTEFEAVGDGADYEPTAKKIFGDLYEDLVKLGEDQEAKEQTRAQIIANYVAANNLSITQYKDYGWDPVTLPEQNIDNFYSKLD